VNGNLTIEIDDPNDEDSTIEVEVPSRWEICHRCDGEGKHVNPNIDGNGITSSEWAEWDDESRETYMSGGYDVTCEECGGSGKVRAADVDKMTPEVREAWESHERAVAECDAETRAERRYFGGDY
jgi:RecJ-like exonuclease